ncbi:helix-turn-helix domain-containing protein [Curtobacterium sp. UNCCL17]|uniref:helix-turn-helix domain-containing protein n=1 Tax=Curtobacterium sp. UNCCL17 TaxID=1449051 RepID=UPI003FA4AC36
MAGGRLGRSSPAELAGGDWPATPSADPHVELARQFNIRLRDAIGDETLRSVAARADLSHQGLSRILAGATWPDMLSISRLEAALGTDLWPRHPSFTSGDE